MYIVHVHVTIVLRERSLMAHKGQYVHESQREHPAIWVHVCIIDVHIHMHVPPTTLCDRV